MIVDCCRNVVGDGHDAEGAVRLPEAQVRGAGGDYTGDGGPGHGQEDPHEQRGWRRRGRWRRGTHQEGLLGRYQSAREGHQRSCSRRRHRRQHLILLPTGQNPR